MVVTFERSQSVKMRKNQKIDEISKNRNIKLETGAIVVL